jgi:hypothetical protein
MCAFLFDDILPIIHCNRLWKLLDLPFCNFPNCWIQSSTMYCQRCTMQGSEPTVTWLKQDTFGEWRLKF